MTLHRFTVAFVVASLLTAAAGAAEVQATQQAPASKLQPGQAPPPPPGTDKVLSFDWYGDRVAACAQKQGGATVQQAGRSVPATEVWVTDGRNVWKTGTVMGACDPAWSPDGSRLVVSAPDGIWLLSGHQQQKGERLTDVRAADAAPTESGGVTFAKPRWSPDATYVAALVSNGGTSWVEVLEVATGKRTFKSDTNVAAFEWCKDARSLQIGGKCVPIQQ